MVKVKKINKAKSDNSGNYVKVGKPSKGYIEAKKNEVPSFKKNISKPIAKKTRSAKTSVISYPEEHNASLIKISRIGSELSQKYNLLFKDVEKAINGVLKARETNPKLEKQLFEERAPLFLNITCHKVPKGHTKIFRIPLNHSVLTPEDEVCLIVPEVKGIGNKDHEKHVEHYENLLESKGVSNINKIMTFHELRTEYETFEQKSRLVDLYDMFLVEGRISGKVVHTCGKIFYRKRKVPTSIKLNVTKLKEHIATTLLKVPLFLHLKGNGFTVQFGHTKMKVHELVENVYCVLEFLGKNFPGKFDNIKGLQVSGPRATSLPIYMSFKNPSELKVPIIKSKKPKAYKSVTGELTTQMNAQVTVMPTGKVLVKKTEDLDDEREVDNITDDDIMRSNKEGENLSVNGNEENEKTEKLKKAKRRVRSWDDGDKDIEIKRKTLIKQDAEKPLRNKKKMKHLQVPDI